MDKDTQQTVTGRFAPSPTGRMHFGNIFAAVLSWLSAHSRHGRWVLRIEDLDPQRSRYEYARQIEDDLAWLGIDADEGGTSDRGPHGPYSQSRRGEFYERTLRRLEELGLVYGCTCTRADIMATQAPHMSDGRVVYSGKCRPAACPPFGSSPGAGARRLYVPDRDITFTDGICGTQHVNRARHCGDFVLRRADGAWAYQLAVVADDAAMGITEVMRGRDLLLSAAQQIYLFGLLGLKAPEYVHIPLVCNAAGQRLSKRDSSESMQALRRRYTPQAILGRVGYCAGLLDSNEECSLCDLLKVYNRDKISRDEAVYV